MFTQSVEYALRAVVYLAMKPDAPQKTADIAAVTKVPCAYLSKVLQGLRQRSIVTLARGVGGGVMLARRPENLTILDVVNAVDPIRRTNGCPLPDVSQVGGLCTLHRHVDNALKTMEDTFASTTLADLVAEDFVSVPLCVMANSAADGQSDTDGQVLAKQST